MNNNDMMKNDDTIFGGLDPEVQQTLVTRRQALAGAGTFGLGLGLALATVPIGFAALSKSAFAQSGLPQQIVDALNFALTLEYLESEFYSRAIAAGTIPASDSAIFAQINKHETAHVKFLMDTLGSQAVAKPTFDFTAKGTFADPFSNYQIFLALSQAFEDTGVRAYKGQAAELMANDTILTAALQIHSVEARHASEVRRLRGQKGWITGNSRGDLPEPTQAIYNGEEATNQGGVTMTNTEAFDEPLSKDAVLAIANLFIV